MKSNIFWGVGMVISFVMGWCMPVVIGKNDAPFTLFAVPFLLLVALPMLRASLQTWGVRRALYIWLVLSLFAYVVEIIGVKTGFPYGPFIYSANIHPLIYGVPVWLPLAWVPLILGMWQLSGRMVRKGLFRILTVVGLLVAMDLVLDPGAVVLGLWRYTAPTSELSLMYYSVPISNYLGWCLSGGIGGLILYFFDRPQHANRLKGWLMPSFFGVAFWTGVTFRATHVLAVMVGVVLLIYFTIMLLRDENA